MGFDTLHTPYCLIVFSDRALPAFADRRAAQIYRKFPLSCIY